jgi:hypothetical protein
VAAAPPRPGWGRRLGLGLLLVVATLAIPHQAPATAHPHKTAAAGVYAESAAAPFATGADQHGIEKRDGAPPTSDRGVARGVAGFAQHTPQHLQPHPILRSRLWDRIPAAPPSRADGGHSPRGPPRATGPLQPLA